MNGRGWRVMDGDLISDIAALERKRHRSMSSRRMVCRRRPTRLLSSYRDHPALFSEDGVHCYGKNWCEDAVEPIVAQRVIDYGAARWHRQAGGWGWLTMHQTLYRRGRPPPNYHHFLRHFSSPPPSILLPPIPPPPIPPPPIPTNTPPIHHQYITNTSPIHRQSPPPPPIPPIPPPIQPPIPTAPSKSTAFDFRPPPDYDPCLSY